MFEIGELVVYGNRGVFQVVSIGALENMSNVEGDKQYYTLKGLRKNEQIVYVPVENQRGALRKVISKEHTLELIERLPQIHPLQVENEKFREKRYRESMDKHECEEWMKVIKTLYDRIQERRLRGKKATSMDERYMQIAKKCLLEEFAVSLAITTEEVESVLQQKIHVS